VAVTTLAFCFKSEDVLMKRDIDLIRQILSEIEAKPFDGNMIRLDLEDSVDYQQLRYHVILLREAGLIDAFEPFPEGDSLQLGPVYPTRLTWEGHEFLEAARDDTRWNKAKDTMAKAGGFVFEVGKALLIELMKQQIVPKTP
jgi:hypothetical protein